MEHTSHKKKPALPLESAGLRVGMGLFGRRALGGLDGFRLLIAQPSATAHFHAAFFIDADTLGSDDIALFDDVPDAFGAAFGAFVTMDKTLLAG